MVILLCKWFLAAVFPFLPGEMDANSSPGHPFYVSVVEINYNAKEKELEIACKVFTNDFESTLEKFTHGKLDLGDPKEKPAAEKAIADYVGKHLRIVLNNQPAQLQFVGTENESEATWCYFQVEKINGVQKIDITDNMLYETFDAQIHIIHVTVNGNRKSTKLANPDSHANFEFP